ncbi:MAG: hypothetical protein DRP01_01600 [Archaeoglobales archaeon]|nr:MAG: hypothetical protein DRP01_01600 [Archaeoglobales archaeon]
MMRATSIWYVFPFYHKVSFNVIGMKHYEQLKKYYRIELIDELAFPYISMTTRPLIIIQPYFYLFQKLEKRLAQKVSRSSGLIGVDVADTDRLSPYAVKLTKYAKAFIVPSKKSKETYIKSGVKKPVHVIPHGIDEQWIDAPKQPPNLFEHLAKLKERRNLKLILSFIVHSPYRKGLDILLRYYQALLKEYNNVLLVVKSANAVGYFPETIEYKKGKPKYQMEGRVLSGWLTEQQKMELFDLCDLYALTSRGGGWEHPPMEALTRGVPVIGAKGGAWEEYMPEWSLIPSKKSDKVLPSNPIHIGYGVEMIIDKAVDRTIEIFNNYEEYKAKVKEHIEKFIRPNLTWDKIGEKLRDVVKIYL